ncbi:10652_t:CDS:2 [Diversispora eburnea]|uniref:10652_t:CDS:1 n=1 Tax=Diversispora eburnea TaxID=1213867 RepID=A0A9N9G5L4_9GLOM|nr:10652_t:CDS:2 [Diversispora eburnea]
MSIFNDRNVNGKKVLFPIFPLIEVRIQQLEIYLTYGTTAMDFAYNKFSIHFSNHPSQSLFKTVRFFDPHYLKLSLSNRDIQKYSFNIPQLLNPSIELLQECEIAFDYMWLPISSCAVEWSFSVYNNILS